MVGSVCTDVCLFVLRGGRRCSMESTKDDLLGLSCSITFMHHVLSAHLHLSFRPCKILPPRMIHVNEILSKSLQAFDACSNGHVRTAERASATDGLSPSQAGQSGWQRNSSFLHDMMHMHHHHHHHHPVFLIPSSYVGM